MDVDFNRLQGRIEELEIGLTHQQRLCDQLNEVVTDQTRRLLRFEVLIPKLELQLRELKALSKDQPGISDDERPPHY